MRKKIIYSTKPVASEMKYIYAIQCFIKIKIVYNFFYTFLSINLFLVSLSNSELYIASQFKIMSWFCYAN